MGLAFNEMLDRIENAFVSQQQFIRNAAHEMRTPLTAITTEADLALLKESPSNTGNLWQVFGSALKT